MTEFLQYNYIHKHVNTHLGYYGHWVTAGPVQQTQTQSPCAALIDHPIDHELAQ